jgi:hypothetical protein
LTEIPLHQILKLALVLLTVSLAACSTHYHTLKADELTDLYPTSTQVDPGGILSFDTSVDPRASAYVLLITDANIRPTVFSFTLRSALAQSGITRVYTPEELKRLARDRGFTFPDDKISSESLRRFSTNIGPVLVVDMTYRFVGDARMQSILVVSDGRTGRALLRVDHPKMVWSDFDTEALYPVLNQLRKWVKQSGRGAA